jgi:hypothetical protein
MSDIAAISMNCSASVTFIAAAAAGVCIVSWALAKPAGASRAKAVAARRI